MESKPADVFAFAMLASEVFTGKVPFSELGNPGAVTRIFRGERPEFPPNAEDVGLTTEMWGLLRRCWDSNPMVRPTIEEVVMMWEGFLGIDGRAQGTSGGQNSGGFIPGVEGPPSESGPMLPSAGTGRQPDRPSECLLSLPRRRQLIDAVCNVV